MPMGFAQASYRYSPGKTFQMFSKEGDSSDESEQEIRYFSEEDFLSY
jgi:hypothetical protein